MIKAKTKRDNYKPGDKLKLRIGFTDKAERSKNKTRICTVIKQYPHVVQMKYDLNGTEILISMTPWEIQHN